MHTNGGLCKRFFKETKKWYYVLDLHKFMILVKNSHLVGGGHTVFWPHFKIYPIIIFPYHDLYDRDDWPWHDLGLVKTFRFSFFYTSRNIVWWQKYIIITYKHLTKRLIEHTKYMKNIIYIQSSTHFWKFGSAHCLLISGIIQNIYFISNNQE